MASDAVALKHLREVQLINFRQFHSDDLRNCIAMESERLNITVKPAQIDEILNNIIDPKRSGCKPIAAELARLPTDEDL